MPVVGRSSINLSLSDVALDVVVGVGFFRTTGFFVEVTTFGLLEPVTFGLGVAGFLTIALRVFIGAGTTAFFSAGPLPLRPSITIFPSCVYTSIHAFSMQSAACAGACNEVINTANAINFFMRGRVDAYESL